jgi:hypothetical protein
LLIGNLSAAWAGAEEFEFMIQALVAGFFANFIFEFMNRTGSLDSFDFSAAGADEVIAVFSGL